MPSTIMLDITKIPVYYINLDRDVEKKENVELVFKEKVWIFAPSMPAQMPEYLADGKIVKSILLALDPSQREDFENLGISIDEITSLIEILAQAYGTDPGESPASE